MSDVQHAEAEVVAPQEGETEVRARRLGWVPKEEFRGDPDKHRSADEFLERGTTILPILQKDNERLHSRLNEVETILKETREASKELLEFTSKAEERAYNKAKTEIEQRIEQAASNADPAAALAATRELQALKPEVPKRPDPATKPTVTIDPVIQDWIAKEDWFTKSPVLNTFATDVYGELERNHPGMSKAEILTETKKRTVDKFPEKFGINPARETAAAVGSPSGAPSKRKGGKTYDDLPVEAKKACDKFMKTIPGYTREKYCQAYDWND